MESDNGEAIDEEEDLGNEETPERVLSVVVPADQAGERIDKLLATLTPLSRSRLRALMDEGRVTDGQGRPIDPSARAQSGLSVTIAIPPAIPAIPEPQAIALTIVYEDDDIVVIDKAAGMVVHPAAGNPDGTLVNALLAHCGAALSGIGGVRRPGIVHRLDKDTSGLIVVAKNDAAHQGLTAQFADRSLSRTYQAVVWGVPSPREGRVEARIGRSPIDRKRMAVVEGGGKAAATRYRVLNAWGRSAALVECGLETGRTHQIRVHLSHIGHPLVGDPVYGQGRASRVRGPNAAALPEAIRESLVRFPRQALHAGMMVLIHPRTGEKMRFTAPLPADLADLIAALDGKA